MSSRKTFAIAALIAVPLIAIGTAVWLHLDTGHGPLAAHLAALHGSPGSDESPHGSSEQSANGEQAPDPLRIAQRGVADIGSVWNYAARAQTVRLYANVHRDIEWPGLLPVETINYGPQAQQKLTLWRPEQEFIEPSLVLLFLHGDGLDGNSQMLADSEDLMFGHLGKLAATFGGIGIVADYRTVTDAGGSSFADPATGSEDLRLILRWIQANVAPMGGDPDTVILLANSQGATLGARYLFDESAQLSDGPGIAAAILSSGQFGSRAPDLADLIAEYDGKQVPLSLWQGGLDTAEIKAGVAEVYAQICRRFDNCPTFTELLGHNHLSHILTLGTEQSFEFRRIVTTPLQALISFYHTVR